VNAIGIERDHLCTGCLTGKYPLFIEGESCLSRNIDFVVGSYQAKLGSFPPHTGAAK
jgi:amidophosphoribosyltransferase